MSRVSCFQRIQLYHDYRLAAVTAAEPDTCANLSFAIVRALYTLNNSGGNTEEEIRDAVGEACPQATVAAFEAAFASSKRSGIVMSVVPSRIDWLGPPPPNKYVLSTNMDRRAANSAHVVYLIQLVGGYASKNFVNWFAPYRAPAAQNFRIDPCAA